LIICAGLIQELDTLHGPGVDTKALSSRVFDLACLLADNVADESRVVCARAIGSSASDTRLKYIFSFDPPPGDNFMLSHKDKTPPAAGRAARPSSMMGGLLGTPASLWGLDPQPPERLTPFLYRSWDLLSEPSPIIGDNDGALPLQLFEARRA